MADEYYVSMTIYFASDHAGFELKNVLLAYVRDELGYPTDDCGAYEYDSGDDFVEFVQKAVGAVSESPSLNKAIILGGSGQGEAMVANRLRGIRAVVYYGNPTRKQMDADGNTLDIITLSRLHNDSNVLSLGARFLDVTEAKEAVSLWLRTEFISEERHMRRIEKIG